MFNNCIDKTTKYLIVFFVMLFAGINSGLCARAVNNNLSAAKVIYVYPIPQSNYLMPQTNIIIRTDTDLNQSTIGPTSQFEVIGSKSGKHDGKVILSNDQRTIVFKPFIAFAYNEIVHVKMNTGIKTIFGDDIKSESFSFYTAKYNPKMQIKADLSRQIEYNLGAESGLRKGSQSSSNDIKKSSNLPDDFPILTVDTLNNPSDGYLFLSTLIPEKNGADTAYKYLIIADNNGNPVFYKKMQGNVLDFKIQPTGEITFFDDNSFQYYIMNTSLKIIDSVSVGNGVGNNNHEIRITPDGNIFLLSQDAQIVDMSKIVAGGDTAAQVIGNGIQELDKNKNIIFDWRSWDHFKITDATHEDLTSDYIDYVHANAIEIDTDGNILLSSRHLDEITKIDIKTGDIIWRLGGKNNQFTFVNDPIGFSHQHAIRRLANGDVILYDDGNYHDPQFSRAVEYKLDEENKTATQQWQYRNNPDIYSPAMGYAQRLDNGNTVISWGACDNTLTEVTKDGGVALAMNFPQNVWSYRVYRFPFVFIDSSLAGDVFRVGKEATLSWNSSGIDSINIDYSTDNGVNWQNIVQNYDASVLSYSWSVPNTISDMCKIRITEVDYDSPHNIFISDSTFSIDKTSDVVANPSIPEVYSLSDNYPNPFNPSTKISYTLPKSSKVIIRIYNVIGQLVSKLVDQVQSSGIHSVVFNAENLSSGIYFCSIKAVSIDGDKEFSSVKKMMLLK